MLLPWRRKVMQRLEELLPSDWQEKQDRALRAIVTELSYLKGRMDDMEEKLDAVVKHVDDVVAYGASVVDAVKKALEYLRALVEKLEAEGHSTAELDALKADVTAAADHVEEKMKELEDKLHEVGASGGV